MVLRCALYWLTGRYRMAEQTQAAWIGVLAQVLVLLQGDIAWPQQTQAAWNAAADPHSGALEFVAQGYGHTSALNPQLSQT